MHRPTHSSPRDEATERLARLGAAAMPERLDSTEQHLLAMREERIAPRRPRGVHGMGRRRTVLVASGLAAFVAMPSLALAGVLPDGAQRAAVRMGSASGIDVPRPGGDVERQPVVEQGQDQAGPPRATEPRLALPAAPAAVAPSRTPKAPPATPAPPTSGHVNGDRPGAPEQGERRGLRRGTDTSQVVPGFHPRARIDRSSGGPSADTPQRHGASADRVARPVKLVPDPSELRRSRAR